MSDLSDSIPEPIYVAGHRGVAGASLVRAIRRFSGGAPITATRNRLNLTDQAAVGRFIASRKPATIVIVAARAGGIGEMRRYPCEFLHQNMMISANLIEAARRVGAKRLMFIASANVYPSDAASPIGEECLGEGWPDRATEGYALGKLAGIKLCEFYRRQYDMDCRVIVPSNLYGPHDRFDSGRSSVLPALVARFTKAAEVMSESVDVWGTGKPRREFLYETDFANACLRILASERSQFDKACGSGRLHLNAGFGTDVSIRTLAGMVAEAVGFRGQLIFEPAVGSEGVERKLLDSRRIKSLGWHPEVDLADGLIQTVRSYRRRLRS